MKLWRRLSMVAMVLGLLLGRRLHEETLETLPFPTAGLSAKASLQINQAGNYSMCATMPKVGDSIHMDEGAHACYLLVRISREQGGPMAKELEITSLRGASSTGWSRLETFESEPFHLEPGAYDVEVRSRKNCQAAVERGAMLTLQPQLNHPTERYLQMVIANHASAWLLWGGLLSWLLAEFWPGKPTESIRRDLR